LLVSAGVLSGCGTRHGVSMAFAPQSRNVALPKGPPIEDLVTPFDLALSCMRGKIDPSVSFAVGQVIDATGKETYADGGSGKFVTQGAGELVQSALFRAGVTLVNRRDPNIPVIEQNWGLRDLKVQTPVNFYVSGSINGLDFIPGGGVGIDIAGIGTRARQSRILIALDLSLTDAYSSRIVSNISLQKQIFTREIGSSTDRFFGQTLVSLEAGGMEREAVHFAMRQLLNFATLELLGQLTDSASYQECRSLVSPVDSVSAANAAADMDRDSEKSVAVSALRSAGERNREQAEAELASAAPPPSAPGASTSAPPAASAPMTLKARALSQRAASFAGRAIAAADQAKKADNLEEAEKLAADVVQYLTTAVKALQSAAAEGLTGPEGDAAAMLVEQAMSAAQSAQQEVLRLRSLQQPEEATAETLAAPIPAPSAPRNQIPGTLESQSDGLEP
jgi:curli biogenesis system outer membrane secretion channel CsgG